MSVIWQGIPPFEDSELPSGVKRYQVGPYWVDWDESGVPDLATVQARVAAAQAVFTAM